MKLEVIMLENTCSKVGAAEMLGLETYDNALPQPWLDEAAYKLQQKVNKEKATSDFSDPENMTALLLCAVVWYYPKGSIFGMPYPLTVRGAMLLKLVDELNGTYYMEALPEMKVLGLMEEGRVL
jgi:hypothetical protein